SQPDLSSRLLPLGVALVPGTYSPISTLETPFTPTSPTYSDDGIDSPSYSPSPPCYSPDHCDCPTACPPPTSPNYCPEGFNDRDRTSPYELSQIHGNCSAAYSPTRPGYGPEYFNSWNHTSPAWESPGYRLTSPIHGNCSEAYSPTAPGYGPGYFATPEYCYYCSVPLEDCCCQAGGDDAPSQ
ncbi:hypothetical protein C2845_PM03G03400, partial [Panicum miliaceum]